jgi:hypothetical protein
MRWWQMAYIMVYVKGLSAFYSLIMRAALRLQHVYGEFAYGCINMMHLFNKINKWGGLSAFYSLIMRAALRLQHVYGEFAYGCINMMHLFNKINKWGGSSFVNSPPPHLTEFSHGSIGWHLCADIDR